MTAPSRHLTTLLSWMMVYPMVTLILWMGEATLSDFPLYGRTFFLTVFLVPVMNYVGMPLILQLYSRLSQR